MKKIFLLLIILLLSGCSATYDLYIGDDFLEDITILEKNNILDSLHHYDMNDDFERSYESYVYQTSLFEGSFDYIKEDISLKDMSGYKYSNSYNHDSFNKKSMVNDCYDKIDISNDDNIYIKTSSEFRCFDKYLYLDDVTVNIYYSGDVIDNNADSVNDNVYSWKINRDNYHDKSIYFEASKIKNNYTFNIIGGIIFVILVLTSVSVIYFINKRR